MSIKCSKITVIALLQLLVSIPFARPILTSGNPPNFHRNTHTLPDSRTIDLSTSQFNCFENKDPEEDTALDNSGSNKPSSFSLILLKKATCLKIYETNFCNKKGNEFDGAYLQYLNLTENNKVLKLHLNEGRDKLWNFNLYPKSFQACSPQEGDLYFIEETTCEINIYLQLHKRNENKQARKQFALQDEKCTPVPILYRLKENNDTHVDIEVLRHPENEHATICLELFTKRKCKGEVVRIVLPPGASLWNHDHGSAKIWEYKNGFGNGLLVRSIRKCSFCVSLNEADKAYYLDYDDMDTNDTSVNETFSGKGKGDSPLNSSNQESTIIAITAVAVFVSIVALVVLFWMKKQRIHTFRRQTFNMISYHLRNPNSIGKTTNNTKGDIGLKELCAVFVGTYKIPLGHLVIGDVNGNDKDTLVVIASGKFTVSYKALLQPEKRTVVVKTLKKGQGSMAVVRNLLEECQLLMHLGKHPGIVEFMGVSTKNVANGELFIVMEWCKWGSLHGFLSQRKNQLVSLVKDGEWMVMDKTLAKTSESNFAKNDSSVNFNTIHLFKWCYEVADAMEFLVSQRIVNSKLSARNVLLNEHLSCKLSDFGLQKIPDEWLDPNEHFSAKSKRENFPWRWHALESLSDNIFSAYTDIWTFGIFMWEVFSLGDIPYQEYTLGLEFLLSLKHGYRLQIPNNATFESYQLMLLCWNDDPEMRPPFSEVKLKLGAMIPRRLSKSVLYDESTNL